MHKEQDHKTFEKGMFPQFGAIDLPKGSYLDALNMYREEDGSMTKEVGSLPVEYAVVQQIPIQHNGVDVVTNNELVVYNTLEGITAADIIVGQFIFEDRLYYPFTDSVTGEAKGIAVIDSLDTMSVVLSDGKLVGVFDKDSKVRLEAKKNYKGEIVFYIAGEGVELSKANLVTGIVTPLFTEYNLPQITSITESLGGNVTTGVYQFFVRYVTGSLNTTNFTSPTGWYPVIEGNITSLGYKDLDGAPPQTVANKELKILIENIDTDFYYIEIGVATYVGEDNVLTGYSLGTTKITGDSKLISFSGSSDYEETLLNAEFNLSAVTYNRAKTITQKDSSLILGNLEKDVDSFDWQNKLANSIVIKSKVETSHVDRSIEMRRDSETGDKFKDITNYQTDANGGDLRRIWLDVANDAGLGGYKDPQNCLNKKSYMNGDVYSFWVVPVFSDGTEGDAYHIPGFPKDQQGNYIIEADQLGAATTQDFTYGSDFGNLSGDLVKYHKIPDSDAFISYDADGQGFTVNMQGIEIQLSYVDPSWSDHAVSLKIYRESREGFETVLGTCIASPLVKSMSRVNRMLPCGIGGVAIYDTGDDAPSTPYDEDDIYRTSEFAISALTVDNFDLTKLAIYSPDYLTGTLDPKSITSIVRRGNMTLDVQYCNTIGNGIGGTAERPSLRSLVSPLGISQSVQKSANVQGMLEIASRGPLTEQRPDSDEVKGLKTSTDAFGVPLFLTVNPKCFVLDVDADLELVKDADTAQFGYVQFHESEHGSALTQINDGEDANWFICELRKSSTNYYGDVFNKKVLFVGDVSDEFTTLFGGDTFISEYGMNVPFCSPPVSSDTSGDIYSEPFGATTIMLPVRSYNNYNFRHVLTEEDVKTVPYYPKHRVLESNTYDDENYVGETGINNFPAGYGQSVLYNTQYSANQILGPAYSHNFNIEEVTKFLDRLVYSATQAEDDVFDSFSLFLADNYHDIPAESGEITALNVVANDLYISTTLKLWRAFYNALITQSTTEGEVLLGNGGAFNRPSVPVVDIGGGYIGTPSQESTVITPSGLYLYDTNRSKLFYVGANGLQEVTNPGMFNYMRDKNITDPRLGYDFMGKRVMLSSPEVTLSFQPELNSFTSRHSYAFSYLASLGIKTFMVKPSTAEIDKFDDSVTQTYFGENYKATFTTSSVVHPALSKRFVGIEAVPTARELSTNKNLPLKFFDFMTAYSYERHTGKNLLQVIDGFNSNLESLGTIYVHKANSKFRMSIPADIVNDINNDIFDETNWVTDPSFSDLDRMFRPDMTDNHLVVEFEIAAENSGTSMSLSALIINFVKNNT